MALIKTDLTKFKGSLGAYPVGPYVMKVMSKEVPTNLADPDAQIVVNYRIEEGDLKGKPFKVWLPVTPKSDAQGDWLASALKSHKVSYTAAGWNPDELDGKTVITVIREKKTDPEKREVHYFKAAPNGTAAVAPAFKR